MGSKERGNSWNSKENHEIPFETVEEAWFWFIKAQEARNDGARFVAGQGFVPRPCEPIDILKVVDRLYRQRRLQRDHLLVMRHYGRRSLAPDPRRPKEMQAYKIWEQAFERLEIPLQRKGIVRGRQSHKGWHRNVLVLEGVAAE